MAKGSTNWRKFAQLGKFAQQHQHRQTTRSSKELNQKLIIIEGATIHGSDRRDMELQVMTVDGVASVYILVHTEILNKFDYVSGWYSETVSYSHRWRGLTGQPVPAHPSK